MSCTISGLESRSRDWGFSCCCWSRNTFCHRAGCRMDDYASLPALLLVMAIFGFFQDPVAELDQPRPSSTTRTSTVSR